jgi:AcrR family transcriptional regulator
MDQVMRRLSYNTPTVYRHFPELCCQIARHYADYRVTRAIARKVQAGEEVRRVACELQAKGISLTRRNLRPLLTSIDYLNLEDGRAALREVRRQMALQIRSE